MGFLDRILRKSPHSAEANPLNSISEFVLCWENAKRQQDQIMGLLPENVIELIVVYAQDFSVDPIFGIAIAQEQQALEVFRYSRLVSREVIHTVSIPHLCYGGMHV